MKWSSEARIQATKTLFTQLHGLSTSKSIRTAVGFGLGGVAFALANLLLARYLSPLDYALFALILALKEFGLGLGPAGAELVINRHKLAPTGRLAVRITLTSIVSATLISTLAYTIYDVQALLVAMLFVMVIGSSVNHCGAALFQSAERFTASLAVIQSHNVILLAVVPIGLFVHALTPTFVIAAVTAGYVIVALIGWLVARETLYTNTAVVPESVLLKDGLGGLGIGLVVLVMWQAERLIIPLALTMEDLATFGVLAAIVSAPFRMMQIAIGYTLLPRLRAATSSAHARRLFVSELKIGALICVVGTAAILLAGPWLIRLFVGDKYDVGLDLFIAAIIVGYLRIWQGLVVASVMAIANSRILGILSLAGLLALALAAFAAFSLSHFGLKGLIYGVGLGWLFQASVATVLARHSFKHRWRKSSAAE